MSEYAPCCGELAEECRCQQKHDPPHREDRLCYWYRQGSCFLLQMSSEWVYDIMSKTPQAKEGVLRCARLRACADIPEEYIQYAQSDKRVTDDVAGSDRWQRVNNTYNDTMRFAGGGNVFRTPPPKKS